MTFKETVTVQCPGTADNLVRLTNSFTTPYGLQNVYNSGSVPLFLGGLDAGGSAVGGQSDLKLEPGESVSTYHAPAGSDAIYVVGSEDCSGYGELTYDAPVS